VFCNSEIFSPFGIYTCHPRALVDPERAVTGLERMLIVEEGEDLIDPFTLVDQVLFVPSVVSKNIIDFVCRGRPSLKISTCLAIVVYDDIICLHVGCWQKAREAL
jgi:hypothetical protein